MTDESYPVIPDRLSQGRVPGIRILVTKHRLHRITPEDLAAMGISSMPPDSYEAVVTDEFFKPHVTWRTLRIDEIEENGERYVRVQWALHT